jgi:hypothetical protein
MFDLAAKCGLSLAEAIKMVFHRFLDAYIRVFCYMEVLFSFGLYLPIYLFLYKPNRAKPFPYPSM